ncbi:uncharacterized protein LOC116181485 [Photinus pyralis]|uniref:uncharacterized protein LOC116181485 n=1 Tax=Photinus pyralis TaxID=7054 RepID=UPI0012670722|nr:uncharacterized protein LOC116181485 [Photinus pyralis]
MKVVVILVAVVTLAVGDAFVCKEGESYKENNCNNCGCFNGNLGCTMRLCESGLTKQMLKCKVGTMSTNACNSCWCVENLGTICTNNKC